MIGVFATDIDGTLTIDRSSTIIHPEVISALRMLEENGIKVVLVSSNALPVVVGLKRYFGLSGPAIGESGALVYFGGDSFEHLTSITARDAAKYVEEKYSTCLYPSWQNPFRLHDYAFHVREVCRNKVQNLLSALRETLSKRYKKVKVGHSGYAVHLTPIDVSKANALKRVSERLRIPLKEFAAAGDSEMDVDMISIVGLGIAVANSDPELKRIAYVTKKPSGKGIAEVIKKIVSGEI